MVTSMYALGESFILFLEILLCILVDILVDVQVLDNNFVNMTLGRKSKGKKRKTEESQSPATQDEPQAHKVSEELEVTEQQLEASQEMPPPTTQASSQPTERRRKEGPKVANIEFPDQVLDAFFEYMEENPVLWSNDKKSMQKQEEAWQRLVLHLKEKFPESDPDDFTCK